MNRREWIRATARYVAFGGIALGSAALVRRGAGSKAAPQCPGPAACAGCPAVGRCTHPQAAAARREHLR